MTPGVGSRRTTRVVRGLRWWMIGLVFLATLINFLDRLTISVLAPVITRQLGLTNLQFASISTWFLVAYTASQGLSGRLYDRVGTRRGFAVSILVWSAAAIGSTSPAGSGTVRRDRGSSSSPPRSVFSSPSFPLTMQRSGWVASLITTQTMCIT